MPTALVTDFTDVQPGRVYSTADVMALFRVSENTVCGWIGTGKLPSLPRLGPRTPHRILGNAILALLGEQRDTLPQLGETPTQRAGRDAAHRDEIRRLAKRRPAPAT